MTADRPSMNRKPMIVVAWIFLLLSSSFPVILLQEVFHQNISDNLRSLMAAVVILVGLALTFVWNAVRSLRPFFLLFLVLVAAEWFIYTKVDQLPFYHFWLNDPSFNVYMLAEQSLRLLVTLVIIAALFILRKRASAFFLVRGDTSAPVEPVKWLGIKEGERWNKLGRNFAIILSLGTLTFLVIAAHPSLDMFMKVVPFVPAVLLAAVMNAFNEEVTYKASFISVLEEPLGKHQALWLMAAYFGLGHYYGIPYGVIGVIMAGFLGWFLGKSMTETRGLWWAWFIHFLQDVLIFLFLAIGSVTLGGG